MAKKEVKTDLWVARQLDDSKIKYDAQGSDVKEINDALQSASKRGTGNAGYPEYVAVVKDFVIVIEDKADLAKHQKLTSTGILSADQEDIADYAVNGAYFYAKHIAQNSSFHKVFAIGVSGDEKHHKITPLYVDDREGYKQLPDIESFTSFTATNIDEYYTRYVLAEKTDVEKTTEGILKDAAELHEYLRTYGSLKDQDKPLVVSGILLALDDKFFKPSDLLGDETTTDGQLIYDAIKRRLKASNVGPDAKRDKLMSEFSIIRTSARLNEVDAKLGKTPLKFYTEFLKKNVFDNIKYRSSSEDFIGRFYGEFMSYSGGDGQTLGIVLTPRHICDLFCDLLDIQATDIVLDPCCGTAGFLVAAMHHMLEKVGADQNKRKNIKKKQLHGFELQSNMFAIAATNMILRDDGNSNIKCEDFLRQNPAQVQLKGATVGMMNPPSVAYFIRQIIRTAFRMNEQPSMKLMFKGYQGVFPDKSFCKLRRRRKCENEQSAVTLPCLPVSFQHITCAQVGNKYELTSALIGQKSDLKLPPNSGEDVSVFYSQLGNNFARIL